MKRILSAAFAIFAFFELAYFCYAGTAPYNLGYVAFAISSGTAKDIMDSTAPSVGYQRYCTNCKAAGNAGTVCTSTGAAVWSGFVLSTGSRCE